MALEIGERAGETLERVQWRAKDSATGNAVGVHVSHEALQDKGEAACLEKAKQKYDGKSTAVHVTTSDF
jgi:hypothetical protein